MAPTAPNELSKDSSKWGKVRAKGSCTSWIKPLAAPALMMRRAVCGELGVVIFWLLVLSGGSVFEAFGSAYMPLGFIFLTTSLMRLMSSFKYRSNSGASMYAMGEPAF